MPRMSDITLCMVHKSAKKLLRHHTLEIMAFKSLKSDS